MPRNLCMSCRNFSNQIKVFLCFSIFKQKSGLHVVFVRARLVMKRGSVQLGQDLDAVVDAHGAAVEGDVVVLRVAPLQIGVVLIVGGAAAVLFLQSLFGSLVSFSVKLHDPLGAEVLVGVDKDPQAVVMLAQDIFGAEAYKHTGSLLGQFLDDLILQCPQTILVGIAGETVAGQDMGKQIPAAGVVRLLFDKVRGEAAFPGHLLQNLIVIAGNAQLFGYLSGDGRAAAAELTADGDDTMTHSGSSFLVWGASGGAETQQRSPFGPLEKYTIL